jgi:predicted transcriptional regulator of viral defense system
MNFQETRKTLILHGLQVFTTQEFINLFKLDASLAKVKLSRYKKSGYLTSPRKGVYYLTGEVENKYKIANKVYRPSYISLDSALSKYGIIPETVYALTSITTKATREFSDDQTIYRYYKIKKNAYTGYHIIENDVLMAEPEKAVVDYLYFVAQGKRELNDRLNLSKLDKQKILKWALFFKDKRLDNLLKKYVNP